jgi:uncharacterized protein YaiE (UPF0345 family)
VLYFNLSFEKNNEYNFGKRTFWKKCKIITYGKSTLTALNQGEYEFSTGSAEAMTVIQGKMEVKIQGRKTPMLMKMASRLMFRLIVSFG